MVKDTKRNILKPNQLSEWKFSGFIGKRIDEFSKHRFLSDDAWDHYYPDTEDAFRIREDGTQGFRGEFWGKYILSAVAACRYYNSKKLQERIHKAVKGLISTQDENGYIGTYKDSKNYLDPTWNIWNRKYVLWGLLEAWELLGDKSILEATCQFFDQLTGEVGPNQYDIIKTGRIYGLPSTSILKPVVMLYRATGNKKYLEYAKYIVAQWSEHPDGPPNILKKGLEKGKPVHTWYPAPNEWAKSYEFISCVEGLLDLYRVTGNVDYLKAAKNIHAVLLKWERSFVGSISFNDKFVGSRPLINTLSEICDIVHWNRLSFELFLLTKDLQYIDEIERTFYNALLCGASTKGAWGLSRLRLSHYHIPAHNHFFKGHNCCVDNLPRGLFQACESAVFKDNQGIYVTLYSEGEGQVCIANGNIVKMDIIGDFLDDDEIYIKINPEKISSFNLNLRIPYWSDSPKAFINDKEINRVVPGTWLTLKETWKAGDIIKLKLNIKTLIEVLDPSCFQDNDTDSVYVDKWASYVYKGDDCAHKKFKLELKDALPQRKAVVIKRGPLVLARDIRNGNDNIFEHFSSKDISKSDLVIKPIHAPCNMWKAYELNLKSGRRIKLCDFSSAGNTWDEESLFNTYFIIKEGE